MPFAMRVATLTLCLGVYSSTVLAALSPPTTGNSTLSSVPSSSSPQSTSTQRPQTSSSPAPNAGVVNSSCVARNLSADTWKQLQLDKYLAQYPGGNNITLAQYADSVDAQNFRCGIEEYCTIGQICNPVPAPDWYVLLATQEWNNCMNSVFKAVHYAVTTVQGTLALMITSIAERNIQSHEIVFDAASIAALIAAAAGALAMGLGTIGAIWSDVALSLLFYTVAFGAVSATAGMVAPTAFVTSDLLRAKPGDRKRFIKWASVGNAFSQWEITMQSMITNTTQAVINSPISSPTGISSVLRDGAFLFASQPKSTSDLQIEYETVLQARSLTQVLRSMGAYVTRGSDKCDGAGPNGAWGGDNHLSFCGSDKIMMNVVLARGDKTVNHIKNAKDISSKFGFSTEYIVTQSWNCQQKFGKFEADPYLNGPLPSDPYADCVMNLPVCDLTDQKINLARKGKNHHTTKACRNRGNLPI